MWTRAELKERAKGCLKKYYWSAFAVSLIFALVSGLLGGNGSTGYDSQTGQNGYSIQVPAGDAYIGGPMNNLPGAVSGIMESSPVGGGAIHMGRLFWGIFAGALVVLIIIGLLISIFIVPVLEVGKNRFYMESRLMGKSAGVGKLLWGFSGKYLNIVWTMFLKELFVLLGTILCVIPGIYLSYCYYLVPYILAENPEMKPMEAMRLSKQMMDGHKFNTFVLEISFIGWFLLGVLLCGIGSIFVTPYYEATFAELYAVLRRPYSGGLSGFGYPDVVPTGSFDGTYVNPDNVYDRGNGYGSSQTGGYQQSQGYGPNGGYQQSQGYGQTGGYQQSQGYGQNGGYQQGYGYGQNGGYGAGGSMEGGQHYDGYGQSAEFTEFDQNHGQTGGAGQTSEGSRPFGDGYYQGDQSGWNGRQGGGSAQETASKAERETEVSRSEGGPGRGYYLNGVFHPYTEDDGGER